MDDNENGPYEPLGGRSHHPQRNTNTRLNRNRYLDSIGDSPEMNIQQPPGDRKNALYATLFATAVSFIMPYNCFILSSDYWQSRFPERTVALDMSMTYIIVAFCTVLLNNVFLSLFSFKMRIIFGYTVSLITLMFVAFCEMAWHVFTTQTTYSVNLAAISLTAVGCTIQQSSFYGFASMFPKKYTQALMAGESFAGFLVATNRLLTKCFVKDEETSTIVFFLASSAYIAMSFVLQTYSFQLPYVRYHMKACSKIILRPDEDRALAETLDQNDHLTSSLSTGGGGGGGLESAETTATTTYGVLSLNRNPKSKITTGTGQAPVLSFCNPVYELSNPSAGESTLDGLNQYSETLLINNAVGVSSPTTMTMAAALPNLTTSINDDQSINQIIDGSSLLSNNNNNNTLPSGSHNNNNDIPNVAFKVEHILTPSTYGHGRLGNFRSGIESRWRVAHAIYPYMVSIALAYCVTLSLYPGLESEIVSCKLKSWMPVLLMLTFNTTDLMGKIIAAIPYGWSRRQLILLAGLRALLIPLLLLCCSPRRHPIIAGETPAFIFTAALGITNGLSGSLPMMLAPSKVPATLKEVTGNMMTLSYNVGLTLGSLIGYIFELMLGAPIQNPCPQDLYLNRNQQSSTVAATSSSSTTTMATIFTNTTSVLGSSTVATSSKLNNSILAIFGKSSFVNAATTTVIPNIIKHSNRIITSVLPATLASGSSSSSSINTILNGSTAFLSGAVATVTTTAANVLIKGTNVTMAATASSFLHSHHNETLLSNSGSSHRILTSAVQNVTEYVFNLSSSPQSYDAFGD